MMLAMAKLGSKVMPVKLAAGAKLPKMVSLPSSRVSFKMETGAITLSVPVIKYSVAITAS